MKNVIGIVLAAGKGTRLNHGKPSEIPKVLHLLHGRPLINYCIESLKGAGIENIILVVGYKGYMVKEAVGNSVKYVVQEKQLGTAHAVETARNLVLGKADYVVVLNGDNPLFSKDTVTNLVNICHEKDATITLVTVNVKNPQGYGRIIKDKEGHVQNITEEKEATSREKNIKEINAGCYCFRNNWLWDNIKKVELSPHGEYYLTDLVDIAVKEDEKVVALKIEDEKEAIGINTSEHLDLAHRAIKK